MDQTKVITFPLSPLSVVVIVVVYYCLWFRKSGIKVKFKSKQKWSVFQDLHRGCLHMIENVNPPGVCNAYILVCYAFCLEEGGTKYFLNIVEGYQVNF